LQSGQILQLAANDSAWLQAANTHLIKKTSHPQNKRKSTTKSAAKQAQKYMIKSGDTCSRLRKICVSIDNLLRWNKIIDEDRTQTRRPDYGC
jgi:LysM repeat protein